MAAAEVDPHTVVIQSVTQEDGYQKLMLQYPDGSVAPYALYPDDPYGWAPILRERVAAGETG